MTKIIILLFPVYFILNKIEAQTNIHTDTVKLSLQDAETLFIKNNFDLLASKYQINEADAAIVQAKMWDNPNLNIEQGVYNKDTRKWFDISETGENAVILQQLFYIAGKRNKRISIEQINSQIAKYQFYDLMRTLRHELRTSFFELYFLQQSLSVYNRELIALKTLVNAYDIEYKKGNIAFSELARLQALQFNLENEKIEVLKNTTEKQSDLILLIGDSLSRPIKPAVDISVFDKINAASLSLLQLLDSGLINRYDLKIAEAQIQSEKTNLALQKAIRFPDITMGARYDEAGSYVHNYNSISISFDLPFWNHNQGNIKIAEYKIEESKSLKNKSELNIKNDITKAFEQLIETDKLYKSSLQNFDNNYEKLLDGINIAYQNHTISLLEFIDYYETYKNSKNEYYHLQINRLDAIEDLNMATGITLIK